MSVYIRLWLGEETDHLAVRNYVFEKAGCTYYLDANEKPVSAQPPDERAPHYNVGNAHNMIGINSRPMFGGKDLHLCLGCHVGYTLNDKRKWNAWLSESIATSVGALLTFPGDAVLAVHQVPIFYRNAQETFIDTAFRGIPANWFPSESEARKIVDQVTDSLSRSNYQFQMKSFDGLDLGV